MFTFYLNAHFNNRTFIIDVKYFDGELRITNVEWNSDLEDNTSYRYQQLADVIETELDQLLSNFYQNFDFDTSVKQFEKGSVIVHFDLEAKLIADGRGNVINEDNILDAIVNNLEEEFGYLFGKFIVPSGSLMIQEKQSETSIYVIEEDDDEEETDINNLEHQLESYESETFSKPRLETFTEMMFDGRTLETTKTAENNASDNVTTSTTITLADTVTQKNETLLVAHQSGTIESTTSLEDTTENETETKTNFEIISYRNTNIISESNDKDLLSTEIESRTDIYDQSGMSDETQTEYFVTEIVNLERDDDIELEYIKTKDNEEDYDIINNGNEVTTDDVSSLEINTLNTNIINS